MRVLLDTHALLWFIQGSDRLSQTARACIEAADSDVLLSVASLWEIAIKASLRKLTLYAPLEQFISEQIYGNAITLHTISAEHVVRVSTLPFIHRDPFDRLLIAQSLVEGVPLISADTVFDLYGVKRFW